VAESIQKTNPPPAQPASDVPPEANAILADLLQQQKEVKSAFAHDDDQKWQYVYMCGRGHIAFFLKKNPKGGTCTTDDWCSTYKPRYEDKWRDFVLCQECSKFDKEGYAVDEHPAQVEYQKAPRGTVLFRPKEEYVYRYPRDAKLRQQIPMHRANIIDISAGNMGVPNPDFPNRVRLGREVKANG